MDIELLAAPLSHADATALLLSDNDLLAAGSGWSYEVEQAAGESYAQECQRYARRVVQGDAFVTGAGALAQVGYSHIAHCITISYASKPARMGTYPIIRRAVRMGLRKLAQIGIERAALYLFCARPGMGEDSPYLCASAVADGLLDHSREPRTVGVVTLAEYEPRRYRLARAVLDGSGLAYQEITLA